MSNQNTGKASTIFHERAADLNNIVLKNQTYQSTRFVCSLLRGLTAGLRNLPTLHHVLALEFQDCALNFHNTRAKELQKVMNNLTNAENLFFVIGFCQLLEFYTISLHLKANIPFISQFKFWLGLTHLRQKFKN